MEDWKKKYEEALEITKNMLDILTKEGIITDGGIICENMERAFPELKESEDERIRKTLIQIVNITPAAIAINNRIELIAWLEKQGEQKGKNGKDGEKFPITEWGEEDESMLTEVILDLEVLMDKDPGEEGKAAHQREIGWLKSLKDRYIWKPSNAQMASITCAVRKMKESACYDSELVSLLNDLKKLKGEE